MHFWQLTLSRRQGKQINSQQWQWAKKAARISKPTKALDIAAIQHCLRTATTQYRSARKTHYESRLRFSEGFDPVQRDRILKAEEQQQLGRLARSITGKLKGGGVNPIQHPVIDHGIETLQTCDTKTTIENALLIANSTKYMQCNASPFLQPPLLPMMMRQLEDLAK